jgi:hypothetical protein
METTRFLDQEHNYLVWDTADRALAYTSLVLARYTNTYTEFQVIAQYYVTNIAVAILYLKIPME